MQRRISIFVLLAALISGCASDPESASYRRVMQQPGLDQAPALFSAHSPGTLPPVWRPLIITRTKTPTRYQLVADAGTIVLHAHAAASASLLMHALDLDPKRRPWLEWKWKVNHLIKGADNHHRDTEDSPVRVVLAFDGDKGGLPFSEQIMFETGRLVSGRELPYASLVYIWEKNAPVGSVIAHTRTSRLKMVVAASGAHGVGEWCQLSRNIVDDYRRAFGEEPGQLIGIGVMSDTDNTGETVDAWYGDIRLLRQQR